MRKLAIALVLCVMLLSVSVAVAIDNPANTPASMASYFSENTPVFFAMRTDKGFVDELDAISQLAVDNMPRALGVPSLSLGELLDFSLLSAGTNLNEVYTWLGDYAAVGISDVVTTGSEPKAVVKVVVSLKDRAAFEAFLTRSVGDELGSPTETGGYTVYSETNAGGYSALAIGDSEVILIVSDQERDPRLPSVALSTTSSFQDAIAALPMDNYNILGFVDSASILGLGIAADPMAQAQLEAAGFSLDDLGATAIGFTIDGTTFVIDSAQLPGASGPVELSRVDPNFARFIPANSNAVIHATDLTTLYNNIAEAVRQAGATSGDTQDPMKQFEQAFSMFGLEFQEDIVSWTTGDYAIFAHTQMIPIFLAAADNRLELAGNFDFGVIIEATDPAKAANLAARISGVLPMFTAQSDEVNISKETINGVDVTVIGIEAKISPDEALVLDLILGASDDVFFFATRDAAENILNGGPSIMEAADYTNSMAYWLPNPTSIWYTDGEGLILSTAAPTVVVLALLGPAIGNVFDNIVDDLQGSFVPASATIPVQNNDEIMQIVDLLSYAIAAIDSSTATATITEDGVFQIRMTITYNPG